MGRDIRRRQMLSIIKTDNPDNPTVWELVHTNTSRPVKFDEVLTDFRGDTAIAIGGEPPHKPSSTGRVWVVTSKDFDRTIFPSVFNLEWRVLK